MTALRELAERWKVEADIAAGKGNMFNGGLIMTKQQCADELLAILDADGDGGAVGLLRDAHAALGRMIAKSNDTDKDEITVLLRLSDAITHPQPARSCVMSSIIAEWRVLARVNGSRLSRDAYTHCADTLDDAIKSQGESNV